MEKMIFTPENLASVETLTSAITEDPATAAAEVLELISEKAKQAAYVEHLNKCLEDSNLLNEELQKEIQNLPAAKAEPVEKASAVSAETFEHFGKVYGFAYPSVLLDGDVITADHVLASRELQAQLVDMESGFLKLIEE